MTPFLLFWIAIFPVGIFLAMRLKESTMVDAGNFGRPLSGKFRYRIHFDAGKLPPFNAF